MNSDCDKIDKIYDLSKLFTCSEIKLCAWNLCENRELLVLYVGNGDFVFYCFTEDQPILKQVPWFSDPDHSPIAISFNPSGSFLLVLNLHGHLYIVPILSLFDLKAKNDYLFDLTDLTIITYPFPTKPKQGKPKSKSPNSSLSAKSNASTSSGSSNDTCKRGTLSLTEVKTNENLAKLKDVTLAKTDIECTAVAWWQNHHNCRSTAIIGTKLGELLFVDLLSGLKIRETSVNGHIKHLSVCQDSSSDFAYLLVTLENKVQYKIVLEQKDSTFGWHNKDFEDNENVEDNLGNNSKGNYLPSARARLQGLKQLSVEKIANLKQKLSETRSRATIKEEASETNHKFNSFEPDYVWGRASDIVCSPQFYIDRTVIAGYHSPTQLVSVHNINMDSNPMCTYKIPIDVEDILLCDAVIFTVSTNRSIVQVISSQFSQVKNSNGEFNPESVLGKWDLNELNSEKGKEEEEGSKEKFRVNLRPDVVPKDDQIENSERVIGIFPRFAQKESCDFLIDYKIDRKVEEFRDLPKIENCVVVTNRNVYLIARKPNIMKLALDWILKLNELEKVEKICTIFRLNLGVLLELAGDIKLSVSDVNRALAFYRVSECGSLKIAVKLSAGGHCNQLLKYSVPLMSEPSFSDMTITERIHLSNLVLMAYTQQILSRDNNSCVTNKFLEFLETNPYYDGILAVSVTGQSFLFQCLHKLMIHKGLILDGYIVLIKLIQRFLENKSLQWTINKDDFWMCLTENCLIEAIVCKSSHLPSYAEYVIQNVESLELPQLDRLLRLTDPTSPYLRSVARTVKLPDDSFIDNDEIENVSTFKILVELFLITLLVKIGKFKEEEGFEKDLLLPSLNPTSGGEMPSGTDEENFESGDSISDHIWPIRKDIKENEVLKRKRESILSCGFGHAALIRNGAVYTWGQTAKGCLGHGPTMSKNSSPQPITWLTSFKLEVTIVSCGKQHTVALTNNGVYAWGCSAYGQLGLGDVYESPHPRLVHALSRESIVSVKCGQYHTLALTNQGSVFAWGWGVHGQLGLGGIEDQRTPKYVHTLREQVIVDIAAGYGHSIVLSDKGHVYSFGSSVYGQLGTGTAVKSSVPVLVKGINGRIVNIATGYFHNLAVTEGNVVYTWGISPLSLRRRRQRIVESEKNNTNSPSETESSSAVPDPAANSEELPTEEAPEANGTPEKADTHLSPSTVDTRDVEGRIVEISCGCHHSALVTDTGSLYSWGRSINQLGNVSQREVLNPTLFTFNNMKVDAVACGCEFTVVQDKQTGKIFNWGSNSVGQLGIPVEESTKCLDGKLIMLKSYKKPIRIPQTSLMSFVSPREVPDIPSSSFTYHTLSKHNSVDSVELSLLDSRGYFTRCLHYTLEKYRDTYNVKFILKKCLEFGNYQAASKITLLENKFKQSMIYQLKGLQNIPQYHPKTLMSFEKQEVPSCGVRSPKSEIMTPESEIHLFTDQGGKEEMCDESNSQDISEEDVPSQKDAHQTSDDFSKQNANSYEPAENYLNQLKTEYVDHAKFIIETYLELCLNQFGTESSLCGILETGIQFWTAEKLPVLALEEFLLQKLDLVYYDLGHLLFCQLKRDSQASILQQFSSSFLLKITAKLLNHIEKNESCFEYLETMSKVILNEKPDLTSKSMGLGRKKRSGRKPETFVQAITEKLKQQTPCRENFINVPSGEIANDFVYYFSCGHRHSIKSLENGFKLFDRINDGIVTEKLLKLYEIIDKNKSVDVSCPPCVYNYIKQ